MKKTFIFSTLFLLPCFLFSQSFYFPINNVTDAPCPFNPNVTITQPQDFLVYQTLDGKWDGEIDSTKCIEVGVSGGSLSIELSQIDPERPLFLRHIWSGGALAANLLYNAAGSLKLMGSPSLEIGSGCENNMCSGIFWGIEIPDEIGTSKILRLYDNHYKAMGGGSFVSEMCLASEKFDENILKELIIKITLEEGNTIGSTVFISASSFDEPFNYPVYLTEVIAQPSHQVGDEYFVSIADAVGSLYINNVLALHNDMSYPSPNNIYYIEGRPEPNSPDPQTINLVVDNYQTIVFQPYTQLRGAFVENDTLRHVLNLINEGGDICLSDIELIFEDNKRFIYNGGNVGFNTANTCMMFRKGGAMTIGKNQTFYYGEQGAGILALGPMGKVIFEENASLIIDNNVMLFDNADYPNEELYITLNKGNQLVFGKHASLYRSPFSGQAIRLNIYMNGGILDDSNLSEEEKSLIHKIYPAVKNTFEKISVFPNPSNGAFIVRFNFLEKMETEIGIYNPIGNLIKKEKSIFEKGIHEWHFDAALPPGIYWGKINMGKNIVSKKIIVQTK